MIKICMNDRVVEGARRLLENAEAIRSVVDLRGCCLALDDCYEVRGAPQQEMGQQARGRRGGKALGYLYDRHAV